MSIVAKEIKKIPVEKELSASYLDYAMSVLVTRALPDVRDGLKPVHRRVLYAMYELSNSWNKPYKKSARIVGDVIGKYHPHGDTAVYDAIVRLAQTFSMRYLLVDGQGNFGSVDGDAPAAMRYTEIRMSKFAHTLLEDLEKKTVDFVPNYDGTEVSPAVLPARVPNLLVNGTSGIAVGMATNIPPHNLNEVIDTVIGLMENPSMSLVELIHHLPGPDFPTYGIINGYSGILSAYKTGRGRIYLRARASIETNSKNKSSIIVTELPYQVNKARLLEKIGILIKEKKINGITALRDESDKDGMRVVVEIRKGESPEFILNYLYAHTQLQTVFGMNMVALDHGQPKLINLKELLELFLEHRREVVTRRTLYDLRKARSRGHILEGLSVALANIDSIIACIKSAKTPAAAKQSLLKTAWKIGSLKVMLERIKMDEIRPIDLEKHYGEQPNGMYQLSEHQVQAILELKLHRLTALETDKIHSEYHGLAESIKTYLHILSDPDQLHRVIKEDLLLMKKQFGDERRTEIIKNQIDLQDEDLIPEDNLIVTLSKQGYVKAQSITDYSAQRRGGKGKAVTRVKEEDVVKNIFVANSHDTILCFSTVGKVYWLKTYQIPQASRIAKGRPIVNLLPLQKNEHISEILPVHSFDQQHFICMATRFGIVKKVALTEFSKPRASGKIVLDLLSNDRLIGAAVTNGACDIMLVNNLGKAIRFHESDVRVMGRSARGVRGMRLQPKHSVISLIIVDDTATLLTATEKGYGQRTSMQAYRTIRRGGQGVIAVQTNSRNGHVVSAMQVFDDDHVLFTTSKGLMVRINVNEISIVGRNTKGVRLMTLSVEEKLVAIERLALEENDVNQSSIMQDAQNGS
jgi:DNA gyrase subunit A